MNELGIRGEVDGDREFSGLLHGPAIVVANHPFGGLDSIVLAHQLLSRRPDAKFMGNFLLPRMEELRPCVIAVDPFGGKRAPRANLRPMREAIRHIESGGVLLVFPAGEVSHFRLSARSVTDPPWSSRISRSSVRSPSPVTKMRRLSVIEKIWPFASLG